MSLVSELSNICLLSTYCVPSVMVGARREVRGARASSFIDASVLI